MKKGIILMVIAFVLVLGFSIYSYVEMKKENTQLKKQISYLQTRIAADKTMTHFRDRIQELTMERIEEIDPSEPYNPYNTRDMIQMLDYLKDMDHKGLITYDLDKDMFILNPAEDDSLFDTFFQRLPGQKTWKQRQMDKQHS